MAMLVTKSEFSKDVHVRYFLYLFFSTIWRTLLPLFLHVGAFLLRFSPYERPSATFFSMWGPFCYVFHHVGAFFFVIYFSIWRAFSCVYGGPILGLPPSLTKTSAGAHDCYFFSKGVWFVIICLLINNE